MTAGCHTPSTFWVVLLYTDYELEPLDEPYFPSSIASKTKSKASTPSIDELLEKLARRRHKKEMTTRETCQTNPYGSRLPRKMDTTTGPAKPIPQFQQQQQAYMQYNNTQNGQQQYHQQKQYVQQPQQQQQQYVPTPQPRFATMSTPQFMPTQQPPFTTVATPQFLPEQNTMEHDAYAYTQQLCPPPPPPSQEARGNAKNYISAFALQNLQREGLNWYIRKCCNENPTWTTDSFIISMWQDMFKSDGFRM